MNRNAFTLVSLVAAVLVAGPAAAEVKIAFIDPLSGGAASAGILAQKTHQFFIDAINAAGGINGEKIELLSFDNKVNPQESLIHAEEGAGRRRALRRSRATAAPSPLPSPTPC